MVVLWKKWYVWSISNLILIGISLRSLSYVTINHSYNQEKITKTCCSLWSGTYWYHRILGCIGCLWVPQMFTSQGCSPNKTCRAPRNVKRFALLSNVRLRQNLLSLVVLFINLAQISQVDIINVLFFLLVETQQVVVFTALSIGASYWYDSEAMAGSASGECGE